MSERSRYHSWAEEIWKRAEARACLLVVINGNYGDGAASLATLEWRRLMPGALRAIAMDLRIYPSEAKAYIDLHREIHQRLQAEASLMIVLEGRDGTGITVLGRPEVVEDFPAHLDNIAATYGQHLGPSYSIS